MQEQAPRPPSPEVVVIGTLVADIRVRPFIPIRPEDGVVLRGVEDITLMAGGLVSNTGVALARLGVSAAALGRVGADAVGELLAARLAAGGLATHAVLRDSNVPTTTVLVCVDPQGERTFHRVEGADMRLTPEDLEAAMPLLAGARLICIGYLGELRALDPHLPAVLASLKSRTGALLLLETSSGYIGRTGGRKGETRALLDRCLPHVDIFIPSWAEARDLTGAETPGVALDALARASRSAILGVKLGEHGCLVRDPRREYLVPAYPTIPIDATGAGDTFLAGFVAAYLRGHDTATACRCGNLAASLAIAAIDRFSALPPFETLLARVNRPDRAGRTRPDPEGPWQPDGPERVRRRDAKCSRFSSAGAIRGCRETRRGVGRRSPVPG